MIYFSLWLIYTTASIQIDTSKNAAWHFKAESFPDHMREAIKVPAMSGNVREVRVGADKLGAVIQVRKFVQMKQMISFMLGNNRWQEFDKFCGYGCWCFPDGSNDIMLGKGPQLDEIDRTCYHLRQCYKCLEMENCDYKDTSYTFEANEDPITGQRNLVCDTEQNGCRRSLCECDREMASGIVEHQLKWKRQLHERYDFDRSKYCSGPANQPVSENNWQFQQIHELPGDVDRQDEKCCGNYPKRHPFDSNRHQCCDNKLVDIGNCL